MIYALLIALALLLEVVIHELGHVLPARLFGDRGASFRLLVVEHGRFEGLGLALITPGFPFTQRQEMVIDLGGVLLAYAVSWLMWLLAPAFHFLPDVGLVFVFALYLFLRLNFLMYAVRDIISNHWLKQDHLIGDMTVFVRRVAPVEQRGRLSLALIALGLLDAMFIPLNVQQMLAALQGSR